MKIKKILAGLILSSCVNGYGDWKEDLAKKFCPSLQLHSGDQGVCPKPVEIISNGRNDGISMPLDQLSLYVRTFQGNELVGDFSAADPRWDVTTTYWLPNLTCEMYERLYKIGGRPPGCASGVYFVFFHYDFGGSGRDSPDTWYQDWHNLKGLYNDTIYAHIFPDGNKAVIQYWFFYPFNDWVNNHEGDWEHINVGVSSQDPNTAKIEYVDYYFHRYVKRCSNLGVDFLVDDNTHPIVFVGGHGDWTFPPTGERGVGEGSHGSYPIFGFWDDAAKIIGNYYADDSPDGSGEFLSYKTFNLKTLPNKEGVNDKSLYWMVRNIPWGHTKCKSPVDWANELLKDLLNKNVGNGPPKGPNFHDSWNDTGDTGSNEYEWYPKTPPSNSGYTIPKVGIITGRVFDKQTNNPLVGATIKVGGTYRTATTDNEGRYKLALPVGKYKLYASKNRYEVRSKEVVVNEGGESILDFSLLMIYFTFPASNIWIESQQEFDRWAFINCPGLGSGVYLKVKRYEVRGKITFPKEFVETPEVLQVQTNGLSGANPNNGSTWADVISVSNKEAIVRTFVYYVKYNIAGQRVDKYTPCPPGNVWFNTTLEGYRESPELFSISGTVTKESNGAPVEVKASAIKNNKIRGSTTTDKNGRYKITGLKAGDYLMRIEKYGVTLQTKEVGIDSDVSLSFLLPDYIYGGDNSRYISVASRHGSNYTFYLYPSDPRFKIYNWGYTIHYAKKGRDDGTYIDYANNRLVIKVRLDGKWYRKAKYRATYYVYGRIPINEPITIYGGNNSLTLNEVSPTYEVRTFYLYPSDPSYKIYKWDYRIHRAFLSGNYGTYIDEANNRLVIKIQLRGFTFHFWWFRWTFYAHYNATYYVYGRKDDSKGALSVIPMNVVEEKKDKPKPKVVLQKGPVSILSDEIKVSIMLKDVEDEITEARINVGFSPEKISIKDIQAPIFEDEERTMSIQEEGTETKGIFLHSEIDNNKGEANIEVAIVPDEEIYFDVATESTTIESKGIETLEEEDEENIAPIAQLIIKPKVSTQGISTMSSDELLSLISIDKIELKNSEGNILEIEKPEAKPIIPTKTELFPSFPNPTKDGCWIPFNLAKDSNIEINIFNILGQKIRTINVGQRNKGSYTQAKEGSAIFWDLKNNSGQNVSKGLYFYKLKADDFSAIKSMVVK
ncbi:MAG: carboxypeptidase regulatory-like domain-containing protein [bacterium]